MPQVLFNAVTNMGGKRLEGPVTTEDMETFMFQNRFTGDDIYLLLKKGENGWYQSGGPNIQFPEEFVIQIGEQINNYIENASEE